jgi:hypothetical protein
MKNADEVLRKENTHLKTEINHLAVESETVMKEHKAAKENMDRQIRLSKEELKESKGMHIYK